MDEILQDDFVNLKFGVGIFGRRGGREGRKVGGGGGIRFTEF